MLTRKDMRPYQKRAAKFAKDVPQSGFFVDMGLGKTVSMLTALSDLFDRGEINKVLLVAPLRVVQGVWKQESRKWEHLRHLKFKLITGDETERLEALQSEAQIYMINVENFVWLIHVLKYMAKRKGGKWLFDTMVIDESSLFKTAGTKRFKTMRFVVRRFKRRHILTGTPAPNGILDIWSQLYIVDNGLRLGAQVTRFKSRFFERGFGYMGKGIEPAEGSKEKIAELISPVILTLRAEDYLDLPPLLKSEVWVNLPPKARALYERMEREMFIEMSQGTSTATHAATVIAKCHQIANGAIFLKDEDDEVLWQTIHDAKLDAVQEVLEGVGSNALIAYYFKHDLEKLRKRFPKAPVIKDAKNARQLTKMQDEWNAGKHPVMLVHPQGSGHGLNLQDGGHLLVFYSLLFGHEAYRQVIERIGPARQVGKARHVLVKHILARGTVDEALLMAQRRKFDDERGFIKVIKEYRDVKEILR